MRQMHKFFNYSFEILFFSCCVIGRYAGNTMDSSPPEQLKQLLKRVHKNTRNSPKLNCVTFSLLEFYYAKLFSIIVQFLYYYRVPLYIISPYQTYIWWVSKIILQALPFDHCYHSPLHDESILYHLRNEFAVLTFCCCSQPLRPAAPNLYLLFYSSQITECLPWERSDCSYSCSLFVTITSTAK